MTMPKPRPPELPLWCGAAALGALYAAVAAAVFLWPAVPSVDAALLSALDPWRTDFVLTAGAWITRLGDNPPLAALAVLTALVLWRRGDRALLAGLAVAVAGSQAVLWASKWALARPRPEFVADVTAVSAAFPSGHATGAVVVLGMVATAAVRGLEAGAGRRAVVWLCALGAAAIGLSRVVVHVHHPSDVLGGFALGGAWLLAGLAVAHRRGAGVRV